MTEIKLVVVFKTTDDSVESGGKKADAAWNDLCRELAKTRLLRNAENPDGKFTVHLRESHTTED